MLNKYVPSRRLPFGFGGEWGKVYKRFTTEAISTSVEVIEYEESSFVDIGVDIQFKKASGITYKEEQPISGYMTKVKTVTVETTDSYWDEDIQGYECCVAAGDIVDVLGLRWIVESIEEKEKGLFSFYYLHLKNVIQSFRRNDD